MGTIERTMMMDVLECIAIIYQSKKEEHRTTNNYLNDDPYLAWQRWYLKWANALLSLRLSPLLAMLVIPAN